MDKRRRLMALVMTSMLVLSSCSAPAGSDYEKARELFAKGQYAQARELFALHADYKNTQQYLGYIDAWAKVEAGDYAGASEAFAELSDFLDSAEEARAYARVADDRTYFNAPVPGRALNWSAVKWSRIPIWPIWMLWTCRRTERSKRLWKHSVRWMDSGTAGRFRNVLSMS